MDPIRAGLGIPNNFGVVPPLHPKRQTIRAHRARHARPGEVLQLYRGMRTKGCFLIGRARCTAVREITIYFWKPNTVFIGGRGDGQYTQHYGKSGLDDFARSDGFADWRDMFSFWKEEHPGSNEFEGMIIFWEPLPP